MQSFNEIVTNEPTPNFLVLAARMPFLSPSQECRSTEDHISRSPLAHLERFNLVSDHQRLLVTLRTVAKILVSPLTP